MIKKYSIRFIVLGAILSSSAVLVGIVYISIINPDIHLEHFSFLFSIIGSIATALTLMFLVVQTNQTQKEKQETEKTSQARMISAWLDSKKLSVKYPLPYGVIVISNKSDVPIFNVVLSLVDSRDNRADGTTAPKEFQKYVHTIPPGNAFITAPKGYNGMGFVGAVEIGFEDSGNRSWIRRGNGKLEDISGEIMTHYSVELPPIYSIVQHLK